MPNATKIGLLISSDLFFTSKVTGTAQALGRHIHCCDTTAEVRERLSAGNVGCVLLDLASPGHANADGFISELVAAGVPVIAFGSHVNVEQLQAARRAGAEALPRSEFSAKLPKILSQLL